MTWNEVQQGSAFGFTAVALIVVFGSLMAARLRMPGLLGLLLGGALIGPNLLDVLPSITTLESVGSIGILYLIFLAGLQLDIDSFIRFRRISAGFGLLTAFIPLVLGTGVAMWLGIDTTAAVLIGSLWASFTLITYPTVSRYGLTKNPAVAAIVGASSITDTISLVMLALIIGSETGDSGGLGLVFGIAFGLFVLAVWCLAVYPRALRETEAGEVPLQRPSTDVHVLGGQHVGHMRCGPLRLLTFRYHSGVENLRVRQGHPGSNLGHQGVIAAGPVVPDPAVQSRPTDPHPPPVGHHVLTPSQTPDQAASFPFAQLRVRCFSDQRIAEQRDVPSTFVFHPWSSSCRGRSHRR